MIKMATRWIIVFVFIALSSWYCNGSSYPVPLLIWSTKSVDVDDDILAGHTLSYEDVQHKYLDKLKTQSKIICLFVQDKLSIDDFATHPSKHFNHLQDVLHSSPTSIVLPSVSLNLADGSRDNRLVKYLEKNSFGRVVPLNAHDFTDVSNKIKSLHSANEQTVFIVHLPEAANGEGSLRSLEPSDEIIGKVSALLSSQFPDYVAFLTADAPRDDVSAGMADARGVSISHVRERRSADSSSDKLPCNQTGVLVSKDELMMYIANISLKGRDNNNDTFKNTTNKMLDEGDITIVTDASNGLTLSFSLTKDFFKKDSAVDMKLTFNRTEIRWWCLTIAVTGTVDKDELNAIYDCREIDVPLDKSYACQVQLELKEMGGNKSNSSLQFEGLQLQPYGVRNQTFANAYDCVPFFTEVIWMGLISVGVLLAILYGGMLALLSINSLDRFDNPKDPPVLINSE